MIRALLIAAALASSGASVGAENPADPIGGIAEPPYVGEPVELSAEQRLERSFHTVQVALQRGRSDLVEDQDQIVCLKQTPTGTHRAVINCATNRFWRQVRESSLSAGLAGVGGARSTGHFAVDAEARGVGGSARKDEKVFTLSLNDYAKLEKRFGKASKEVPDQP